jgi:hypothetical protein
MRETTSKQYPYKDESGYVGAIPEIQKSLGNFYAYDNLTGNSVSLKTRDKSEADQKVNAMNEAERQPGISLGLAKVAEKFSRASRAFVSGRVPPCTRLPWNPASVSRTRPCASLGQSDPRVAQRLLPLEPAHIAHAADAGGGSTGNQQKRPLETGILPCERLTHICAITI